MNIQKMLKQAQQMQAKIAEIQQELASRTVEGSSGGGKVLVTATCTGDVQSLKIDPSIVDPSDVDFLQDLILAAIRDAQEKGRSLAANEMKKITGGLGLPGGLPGLPL